jgi:hypothetical protein
MLLYLLYYYISLRIVLIVVCDHRAVNERREPYARQEEIRDLHGIVTAIMSQHRQYQIAHWYKSPTSHTGTVRHHIPLYHSFLITKISLDLEHVGAHTTSRKAI